MRFQAWLPRSHLQQMIKSSFGDQQSQLPSFKVIILGQSSAGKSALLTRYKYDSYSDKGNSTLMVDCTFVIRKNGRFGYYDTAGQEKYRAILNIYFKGSDAALLVYAVDNQESLNELAYYHEQLRTHAPNCKIYLVATKSDLPRTVTKEQARKAFPGMKHFETSAKLNQGVFQAFQEIQKELLAFPKQSIQNFGVEIQRRQPAKPREKCCLSQ